MKEVDKTGCFVFAIVRNVTVRNTPAVLATNKTKISFADGDLVSVDLIRTDGMTEGEGGLTGPFLRLADGSGWLFQFSEGFQVAEQVNVFHGLRVLYADNYPAGVTLRSHPMDRVSKGSNIPLTWTPKTTIPPMTKIYCDRGVRGANACYYRVQGKDNAWVMDRRSTGEGENNFTPMVLREGMVQTGFFAFQALCNLEVQDRPDLMNGAKTGDTIRKDELVVCDVIRESPFTNTGIGPFLHLMDCSGWVSENKNNRKVMERIHVASGTWRLVVVHRDGIQLRKQPRDRPDNKFDIFYKTRAIVTCDKKVKSPSGVNFYRVKGTRGWVFDKRGCKIMMEVLSSEPSEQEASGWSPDFVRGMATGIEDMKEVAFNPTSRVISFRNKKGVRINVYYTTRTVGTAMDHPTKGKTQLFRRECSGAELAEILKNPRIHTGRGYFSNFTVEKMQLNDELGSVEVIHEIDVETEMRESLVKCDNQIEELHLERARLLNYLVERENERLESTKRMQDEHAKVLEQRKKRPGRNSAKSRGAQTRGHQLDLSCSYCQRPFGDSHALKQHQLAVGH